MKLSDRVVAGAKLVVVRYALASEAGFDDGQSPVSAAGAFSALGTFSVMRTFLPTIGGGGVADAPATTAFEFDGAIPHLLVDLESTNVGG